MSDLYQEDFDPRISDADYPERLDTTNLNISAELKNSVQNGRTPDFVKREINRAKWADYIIFVAPVW